MSGLGDNLGKYLHPKNATDEADKKLRVTTEWSRYTNFDDLSDSGKKAYNADVGRMNSENASLSKRSFRQSEDAGYSAPATGEPQSGMGDKLRPRIGAQRLKPKTPEQAKESADDAEVLRTRASLIGTRG